MHEPPRLSGLDASFLYAEHESVPMHTLKIAVLEGGGKSGGRVATLKSVLARKLRHLPAFRQRLVEVPLGLDHPRWVEAPDIDLDRHIRTRTIAAPHTMREADRVIAEIAAAPLARDRPLWEVWLLEPLHDGGIVVVAKIHHALADGTASVEMLLRVMSELPDAVSEAPSARHSVAPEPSRAELVTSALVSQARRIKRIPALVARTAQGGVRALRVLVRHGRDVPLPFVCPHVPFNCSLGAGRSFATTSVPLERALAVKSALGVTLNDVVLYLVSSGLETELTRQGVRPERPLLASVPVALGAGPDARRLTGNRLANLFTSLCTDVADPVERVRTISHVTQRSKEAQRELGLSTMFDWSELVPGGPYRRFMHAFYASHLADRLPAPANVIVSNVAGPRAPLFVAGTRLCAMYSVGPLVEGMGVNITIWSYAGTLTFSVLADRAAIPEAHVVTDAIAPALSALAARVAGAP